MKTVSEIPDANSVLDHFPQAHCCNFELQSSRNAPLHPAASRQDEKRSYCGPTFLCSEIGVRSPRRLLLTDAGLQQNSNLEPGHPKGRRRISMKKMQQSSLNLAQSASLLSTQNSSTSSQSERTRNSKYGSWMDPNFVANGSLSRLHLSSYPILSITRHDSDLPKRPTLLSLTKDGQRILVSDKFGDVFR